MSLPAHIAIVMDGNGRWATARGLPRAAGHRQGVEALRRCVRACVDKGVSHLTVFAFSSENWQRPPDEISGLMGLLVRALSREVPALAEQGVRLKFAGSREGLSASVLAGIDRAQALTAGHRRLTLTVAFNYGGRWDIVQACQRLVRQGLPAEQIDEASIARELALSFAPDPDLLIRTGGEQRISNFLLWQSAYAELYFTDRLWPDFDATDLQAALDDYARRERRFGRVEPVGGAVDAAGAPLSHLA